jgi:UDP-N-acetylmuramoylalanine--D-glutamate ligase
MKNMVQFQNTTENKLVFNSLYSKMLEMRNEHLKQAFKPFEGYDHRLEFVKTINEIDFIDDAKASNISSTWYSLEKMHKPVTLISNISHLDDISEELFSMIKQKVKRIVFQGVYSSEMLDLFTLAGKEVLYAETMEDAVRVAFYASDASDTILYSPTIPAAKNAYTERGQKFRYAIAQL